MARVTVEDCLKFIPNRFELALVSAYRAKNLMAGATQILENAKNEKYTVISLREIGDNLLDVETLKNNFKKDLYSKSIANKINSFETKKEIVKEKPSTVTFDLEKELDEITEEESKMFADENVEVKD